MKVRTALISVYDKENIVEFAAQLNRLGITILSTGGTAKLLEKNKVPVIKIEDYTGLSEILDGRVKTLNYKVFGGILARKDFKKHLAELDRMKIKSIDMVVVNLYPFEKMVKKKLPIDEMIEYIDIGGNTLLRAAAKNFKFVLPVYDKKYYPEIIVKLKENNCEIPDDLRIKLAKETFFFTSYYDSLISRYLSKFFSEKNFPEYHSLAFEKIQDLRYGENPHQSAVYYKLYNSTAPGFKQLWGKELSFNNIFDFYASANIVAELKKHFSKEICVIIKHRNPCGASLGNSVADAYKKALSCDPISAFGGIVCFSGNVDEKTAKLITKRFYEIVVAKNFNKNALNILKTKKNLRLIKISNFNYFLKKTDIITSAGDTILIQEKDVELWKKPELVTKKKPTKKDIEELKFGWIICKYVKSNAIVYTKNFQLIGVGAGQTSRIDSAKFGAIKAKEFGFDLKNAYLASDAFFPFADSIKLASKYGIKAIIQPGGSIRDEEVIAEANKHNIIMLLTGMRHFNH